MSRCTAHNRRGEQCGRNAVIGRNVCNLHGGKTLTGLASPTLKDGRYSKYLPARLAARYGEAISDPNLISLREEIALTDARLGEVLGRLETGERESVWDELATGINAFEKAVKQGDAAGMKAAIASLTSLPKRGNAEREIWIEVGETIERRRKLVETEHKRLVAMQQMMTSEQAMMLITAVVSAVQKHVTDRSTLMAIQTDLTAIMSK